MRYLMLTTENIREEHKPKTYLCSVRMYVSNVAVSPISGAIDNKFR
jgi:hypothetical protein